MNTGLMIKELNEEISESIDISRDYSDDEIMELIEASVLKKSREVCLSAAQKKEIVTGIFNSKRRLDILQPLVEDKTVTEIMINGKDAVFTERRGRITKENIRFDSEERLYNIIQSIVSKVNRVVNEASPIVEARLKDGSRVSAVLPPIALNGPILTIRKFPEKPLTINELINMGSLTHEAAGLLEKLVKAKYNIFVCGGTGSGKTTFLNALSNFIPGHERIVTIEDSAELQITSVNNVVRLETRNPNTEGKGEITIRELIKTSLRMRPDRIIVGEVRGAEALDMLQAMNTGHDGSLSTGHANSAVDMLSRLETMVLCASAMPLEAIRQQIASAIDIIIYLGRMRDMTRKVLEISEVMKPMDGRIVLNPLYTFNEDMEAQDGSVVGSLRATGKGLSNIYKLKAAGMKE